MRIIQQIPIVGSGQPIVQYKEGRHCELSTCGDLLARSNPGQYCFRHSASKIEADQRRKDLIRPMLEEPCEVSVILKGLSPEKIREAERIVSFFCRKYSVTLEMLCERAMTKKLRPARHLAMHFLHQAGLTTTEIVRLFARDTPNLTENYRRAREILRDDPAHQKLPAELAAFRSGDLLKNCPR